MTLPKTLLEGYRRFRPHAAERRGRLEQLAELGQVPIALVVTCCDARLSPQEIFDAEPGALFVVRNVANLVPPYEVGGGFHGTSAAIEFAVLHLRVPHIVVLGHSRCGGVAAYRRRQKTETGGDHISRWMSLLDVAASEVADSEDQTALERAAIRTSLTNLRSFAPLREREQQGRLTLHGVHYDIGTAELSWLEESSGRYLPVEA